MRESFPVQRVTIRRTTCWRPGITKEELNSPLKGSKTRSMTFGGLIRDPFWLAPLAEEGSNISVSIIDVFPSNQWDPSSQMVFWPRISYSDSTPLTPGIPITAGVAHISLELPVKGSGIENKVQHTAIVTFGLVPTSPNGIMTRSVPWCYLINNSGSPDLEQLFTSQVAAEDGQPGTSLAVERGFMLNAAVQRTAIASRVYCLLRIWVAQRGEEGESADALAARGEQTLLTAQTPGAD